VRGPAWKATWLRTNPEQGGRQSAPNQAADRDQGGGGDQSEKAGDDGRAVVRRSSRVVRRRTGDGEEANQPRRKRHCHTEFG